MEDFNVTQLIPIILILIGTTCTLFGIFKKSKESALKANGKKAEGIIFSLEASRKNDIDAHARNVQDIVTVRFVTESQEWITAEVKQDFAIFYTKQYKEGDTVQVYYDPKNPKSFYVDLKQSETLSRLFFSVGGLILIGVGLYKLLSSK